MKKLASMIVLAASVSLAALQPASARAHRHHSTWGLRSHDAALAHGYYGGRYGYGAGYDHASSPYAGGP